MAKNMAERLRTPATKLKPELSSVPSLGRMGVKEKPHDAKKPQQEVKPKGEQSVGRKAKSVMVGKAEARSQEPPTIEQEAELLRSVQANKDTLWMVKEEVALPENPIVRLVFEDIARAPQELLRDPDYLVNQGVRLRAALTGDVPREQQAEARALLKQIRLRVEEIVGVDMDNPSFRQSENPDVRKKIQYVEDAYQRLMAEESGMMPAPGGAPNNPDSWIDRDEHGNPIQGPIDYTDNQGQQHDLMELRKLLDEMRTVGESSNPGLYEKYYQELTELPRKTNNQVTEQDIGRYRERMRRIYYSLFGDRHRLTAEEITKIERDPIQRDEEFYKRLKKLLERQEDESHRIMGLFEQADMDAFLHAVGEIREPQGQRIGDELVRRYEIRMQGLMRFHDVDYWARHPSGDIKSYAGTVAQIQNYHAKEAMSDPYVEIMRNCYEKALLFIRATHDGYIPPNLVTPDPLRGVRTFWDDLALKFFKEKVATGQVFDVRRDPVTGIPERDDRFGGNAYKLEDNPVATESIEQQHLRLLATQQIAKGLLVLDERTLEIIGMSKVPGFDHKDFGIIKDPGFSSKAYGQLARWFNPIAEWMGKYKMGTTLHVPFFQTLIEGRPSWVMWSSDQWRKVMESVMDGRLEDVFGSKAKRFIDMMEEFSFSGRWGPMSKWGTRDATIGWTDKMKERLGGSMRMVFASEWAEGKIKDSFKQANPGRPNSWYEQEWEKIKVQKDWKVKIDNLTKAKRAWLWVQLASRHPTIVAGHLKEIRPGGTDRRLIRDRIISDILHINLEDYYKVSNRTPTDPQRDILLRIAELEGDIDAVQQKAMNITEGKPRDIVDGDFNIIQDEQRRQNAKTYWEMVKKRALGEWSSDQWYDRLLGANSNYRQGQTESVWFSHYMDIDSILQDAANAVTPGESRPSLNKDLVERAVAMQHISTEDVQWRFLDIETLGPPHWNRRAGDLSVRIEAIQKEIEYLDMLTANPDREKLAAKLNEVFMAEKNHDPEQGHKMMYVFALATGDLYRQDHWGRLIPFGGRIASRIVPSSIAQKFFESLNAAAWSANNERHWVDRFSDGRTLPLKEFYGGKHWGRYNARQLAKDLGADRFMQITEMVLIGLGISYLATALLALTKSVEEESK